MWWKPILAYPVLAYMVETNFGLSCIGLCGANPFWLFLYWLMWWKPILAYPVLAYMV